MEKGDIRMTYQLNPSELALIATTCFGSMQKHSEFTPLLEMLEVHKPKVIVEIGIGKGGSTWAFSKIAGLEKHIIIDLPSGPWGGEPPEEIGKTLQYINANSSGGKFSAIFGNSQNSECLKELEGLLEGDKIDFLMIDGDHSYAGVKTDYLTYSPLVRTGGLIALHDVAEHPKETECEVKKFWDEIKESGITSDLYTEFIDPNGGAWAGLGIVRW